MDKIIKCNSDDYGALLRIWEGAVRATHDFLTESVIEEIKAAMIPDYFPSVDLYAIHDGEALAGFIGICDDKIEMLFIDPKRLRNGFGSKLIDFAKQRGAKFVDVNEQNQSALKFYLAKGFGIVSRDERDEAGRPYPILHLSL